MTSLDIGELFARLWAKENARVKSAEEIHDRNFQWLKDITDEAKSLFKKESIKVENITEENSDTINSNGNETGINDSVGSAIIPILLPKTPRETKAREARIQKIQSRSTGRPSYPTSRSGRAASRAATSRIRNNLNEKLNKKMRRPTEINGSKANASEHTSSINTEDSTNSEEEHEKISSERLPDSTHDEIVNKSTNNSSFTDAPIRKSDDQSKHGIINEVISSESTKSVHFHNENEGNLSKDELVDEEPTSKRRRSSNNEIDEENKNMVKTDYVDEKPLVKDITNADKNEEDLTDKTSLSSQSPVKVTAVLSTTENIDEKITIVNEEIEIECETGMKTESDEGGLSVKDKTSEADPMCSEEILPNVLDSSIGKENGEEIKMVVDEAIQESAKDPVVSPPKIRVLRSNSSVATSETEDSDGVPVRRSTRNKKKVIESPRAIEYNKKFKGEGSSPIKTTTAPVIKSNATPNAMGSKSISLASLRHPNQKKNTLLSAAKSGKNCSTSALIAAAKASSSKANSTRKFTPQSPLKDTSIVNAALGIIGSGGQHYHSANGSSGSSTLNRIRSRIGNVQKSPIKSASKNLGNIPNIRSFLPQKPAKVPKPTAEEIQARKEEELNLKKLKADEAMKKKAEDARAKQEERRLQNEARQKRVLEARQAKEQQKIHEAKERQEAITRARQQADERRRHDIEEKRKKEIEQEKKRMEEENERKRQDELERKRKLQFEEEKKMRELENQKQRQLEAEQRRQEAIRMENMKKTEQLQNQMRARLDETYNKDSPPATNSSQPSNPNSTFTKENKPISKVVNTTVNSYDITPARHELPPEELVDEDNYDIAGLRSDEDTDDEDNPRKVIPKWAQSTLFRTAIMKQAFNPPNLDNIFFVQQATIDLSDLFKESEPKRRYYKRTSSAVWNHPPKSHSYRN